MGLIQWFLELIGLSQVCLVLLGFKRFVECIGFAEFRVGY